ncbi:MAG: response regulator [Planctomycetes bacterium]|nr:response regulator [Planctomycetota bacterium]
MKLRTQLFLAFLIVFFLMLGIAGVTYQSISAMIKTQADVDVSNDIEVKARKLKRLLSEMSSAERGYAFTGNNEFLDPYAESKMFFETTMNELKELSKEDRVQTEMIGEIEAIASRWQNETATIAIDMRNDLKNGVEGMTEEKIEAFLSDQIAKGIRDQFARSVDDFIAFETAQLAKQKNDAIDAASNSIWFVLGGTALAIGIGLVSMFIVTRSILGSVGGEPGQIASVTEEISKGNLDEKFESLSSASTGIAGSVRTMLESLRASRDVTDRNDWLKTGLARIANVTSGDPELDELSSNVISEMATYLGAEVAAMYFASDDEKMILTLSASYAYTKRKNLSNVFAAGEGLVGQAALERKQILLKNVPEDYIKVTSGLGERTPSFICVTPFAIENRVKGVIEIGTLGEMTDAQLDYLGQAMSAVAIAVESAHSRSRVAKLLKETQDLAAELTQQQEELKSANEKLQVQQEELQTSNEELEEQAKRLEESEQQLRAQQEELSVTNEELNEKNRLLERQKREVETAREAVEEQARELAIASKYKSEFLANMSHELRTPLNSLLLLAQSLSENRDGNLREDQIESARIIYSSGNDLLNLINEILDLSKIEAGKMDLHPEQVNLSSLADSLKSTFSHMAAQKELELRMNVAPGSPTSIISDRKRVEQIIRNLMSNALKFTEQGFVAVTIGRTSEEAALQRKALRTVKSVFIEVHDTGIGISEEQQKIVFEAFHQGDGGTSRKYGGTGLGLSISRELARLLGGEIHLESELGKGSKFTLFLPEEFVAPADVGVQIRESARSEKPRTALSPKTTKALASESQIDDDRDDIKKGDRVILIIEDDPHFAKVVSSHCHGKGFKCIASPTGETGIELALEFQPHAIILDIRLPGMDGWAVLSILKDDIRTRHIPVHFVSVDNGTRESFLRGAVGHATKPLDLGELENIFKRLELQSSGRRKRILIVEDDDATRNRVVELIGNGDVDVDESATGSDALQAIRSTEYDCIILDLKLPDMDARELLGILDVEEAQLPPVIVHTAGDLSPEDEANLQKYAESIIVKDVRSEERLLDEVSLFLHRVVKQMPEKQRKIIRDLHDSDSLLRDKRVLIVDDDMRTTFALSRLLTDRGMVTLKAENGEKAIGVLEREVRVDIVLMDIMMPVMDGYEAMRKIRSKDRFSKLPIIALTAKAMLGDHDKCIAAGASDYLPKPVDPGRLVSMMRVWLYR